MSGALGVACRVRASMGSDASPVAGIRRRSLGRYDAGCEIRRAGAEPLLGTCASVALDPLRLIRFGQAPIEAPDAGVIGALRWIEPQDDGTGMVLLRHPRRAFCDVGKGAGGREPSGFLIRRIALQRRNRRACCGWRGISEIPEQVSRRIR